MGVEWFRDLSIAILGFVTTAVIIFAAVLVYRLYRTVQSTLLLVKAASKIVDTITLVQEGPVAMILTLIQGIRGGFKGFSKIFKKGK